MSTLAIANEIGPKHTAYAETLVHVQPKTEPYLNFTLDMRTRW
jgi:hypothetical protein